MNDHRIARRVWKIRISMHVNSISSKDTGETRTIYVWSDNEKLCGVVTQILLEILILDIIRELFLSLSYIIILRR